MVALQDMRIVRYRMDMTCLHYTNSIRSGLTVNTEELLVRVNILDPMADLSVQLHPMMHLPEHITEAAKTGGMGHSG